MKRWFPIVGGISLNLALNDETRGFLDAKRNAIFISIFARERQSGRERNVRTDNSVPAVHVILAIEEMHRAAETA